MAVKFAGKSGDAVFGPEKGKKRGRPAKAVDIAKKIASEADVGSASLVRTTDGTGTESEVMGEPKISTGSSRRRHVRLRG